MFLYEQKHENIVDSALWFFEGEAFLVLFYPVEKSTLTAYASPLGLGAVSAQNEKPIIFRND